MTCLDLHSRPDRSAGVRRTVLWASIGVIVLLPSALSLVTAF